MIHDLFWIYGCNIVVNSAMAFFTSALLILGGMALFRIKEPRIQALILTVPFIKLVMDLFLYNFSAWALGYSINPLEVEPGSRMVSIWLGFPPTTGIQLLTSDGKTFTIADLMTLSVNPLIVKASVICAAMVSAGFLAHWVYQLQQSLRQHNALLLNSRACQRPIFNPELNYRLLKANVRLVVSDDINVPCAIGLFKKHIVYPTALLMELSQNEFEAVAAHELDHLRWYDSMVRLGCNLLGILFWWIPTRWYLKRIERLQEYACDRKVSDFAVPSVDLASAIYKAVKFAKNLDSPMLRTCFVGRKWIARRIQMIVEAADQPIYPFVKALKTALGLIFMTVILLGKFWIF